MAEDLSFDGTVLVTAGASGIGRQIAETFLAAGADVHICDISEQAIAEFLDANPTASATVADISDLQQVERVFAELTAAHKHLRVLVNNAGIAGTVASVDKLDPGEWQRCIDVNLSGNFYVTRLAVPLLKKSGNGSIINMSSSAGLFGCPDRSAYVASKWALIGLTKSWAIELGGDGIRVNAICPGSVAGDRIDAVMSADSLARSIPLESIRQTYEKQNSLRKFIGADDVANMAVFLASDYAGSISGQAIAVDGNTERLVD